MITKFKLFENHEDIHNICKKYDITNYTINDDGSIDVDGNVSLGNKRLKKIPLNFRNVSGYFTCRENQLFSLKGSPINVGKSFSFSYNKIISLDFCPQSVGGGFYCSNNQLTSLEGCPIGISGDFVCDKNNLSSLKGSPISVGDGFHCQYNDIKSLEGFPENLVNDFYYSNNPIAPLICEWINKPNRDSMVEYFNDLDIIRDDGEVIIMDRLEEFMQIYNIKIDLEELDTHYQII